MKKIVLLSVLLTTIFTFSMKAQQVDRELVIVEIATGTWCYYCPGAAMGADDLIANGKDVAIIEYHNGDAYTNAAGNSRNSYNSVGGIPDAHFDGVTKVVGGNHTQTMYPQYLPRYNQRKAIMSSYTIDVDGTTAGFSDFFTTITLEKVAASTASNIKLHVVVTESDILENWQGMTELHYVERLMAPDQYGTAIDFTSGDTQTANINFTIDDSWNYENCELVVFLQDNGTHEILQGFKMDLADFGPANDYDVALTDLNNVPEGSCSDSIAPRVTLRNNSDIELTSADISYSVNGGELSTIPWSGNLGYLQTAVVDLPSIAYTSQEDNTVTVYTSNPNGNTDEFMKNDTLRQDFAIAMSVPTTVNLMLRMDNNPEDISWELKNGSGEVIYSGGDYTEPGENIVETFELEQYECYSFAIYDSEGNGLDDPGFFVLFYGGSSTILEGSAFGSMSSTEFTTGWVGIGEDIDKHEFSVSPNPFSGQTNISFYLESNQEITMDIFDLMGKKVQTLNMGILNSGEQSVVFNANELTNGIYIVSMNINNKVVNKRIIVK